MTASAHAMKISPYMLQKIILWEGRKLAAYQDIRGIWTIGVGHTGPEVRPGLRITEAQCEKFLAEDILLLEEMIQLRLPRLRQNQFDALVSLAFNIGLGNFFSSTAYKMAKIHAYALVPWGIRMWNKTTIGGKKVPNAALTARRAFEADVFAGNIIY